MIQRKRKPWRQHEETSLLRGIELYGVGNWQQMLADPKLNFDDRTTVDLKDKYRNIMKKKEISGLSFQTKPIPRKSPSKPIPPPVPIAPQDHHVEEDEITVKNIFTSEDGIKLTVSMGDKGEEKEVNAIELPEQLEYILDNYKKELKRKYTLANQVLQFYSDRRAHKVEDTVDAEGKDAVTPEAQVQTENVDNTAEDADRMAALMESYRSTSEAPTPKKAKHAKADNCVIF